MDLCNKLYYDPERKVIPITTEHTKARTAKDPQLRFTKFMKERFVDVQRKEFMGVLEETWGKMTKTQMMDASKALPGILRAFIEDSSGRIKPATADCMDVEIVVGVRYHIPVLLELLLRRNDDFKDASGQSHYPLEAAISMGFQANPKLIPFFHKVSEDGEGTIDARGLVKIGVMAEECTGPSNYLMVIFEYFYSGMTLLGGAVRRNQHLNCRRKAANAELGELLKHWDEEAANSEHKVIIGWPKGTIRTLVLTWETIFICCLGCIRQGRKVQLRPFTIDVREGSLSLRSIIGCYLLYVQATRNAAEYDHSIPSLQWVGQLLNNNGEPMFSAEQLESAQVFYRNLYKDWLAISSADDLLLALRHTFRSGSATIRTLKTLFPADGDGLDEYYPEGTRLPPDFNLDQGLEAMDRIMQEDIEERFGKKAAAHSRKPIAITIKDLHAHRQVHDEEHHEANHRDHLNMQAMVISTMQRVNDLCQQLRTTNGWPDRPTINDVILCTWDETLTIFSGPAEEEQKDVLEDEDLDDDSWTEEEDESAE